jgi:aspartyl-tRNA(Asn)/glutamyl-tRNA(Gln) amidotransferase subunit A
MKLNELSASSLLAKLTAGEVSSVEAVEATLEAIEGASGLGAFITLRQAEALVEEAKQADAARKAGSAGPLCGVPVAVKDNLCTKDLRTTAASRMLADFVPPYDATAVRKLKEAGAIIVGKTNLDEFAMGSSNETSYFGKVENPVAAGRIPGGSSGGSAAAVAAHLCAAALGSDTGGSVRQPASHTGIVGLKPTYGRISRYGLIAFASSLDQIGPMTKSVEDAALLLNVLAGRDPMDSTSAAEAVPDFLASLKGGVEGLTIGIPKEYFEAEVGIDESVIANTRDAIAALEAAGAKVKDISLPHTQYAVATYYLICTAEASSNLARYDGARYGYRAEAKSLVEMYEKTRAEGFGDEVKRRIMLGTFVLSTGYYDAYYRKAQQVRALIRKDFEDAFADVDLIVTPTTPSPAFGFGEKSDDPLQMYLEDIYTVSSNLAGIPGLSLKSGVNGDGLPTGVQLLAPAFREDTIFRAAHLLEQTLAGRTT